MKHYILKEHMISQRLRQETLGGISAKSQERTKTPILCRRHLLVRAAERLQNVEKKLSNKHLKKCF